MHQHCNLIAYTIELRFLHYLTTGFAGKATLITNNEFCFTRIILFKYHSISAFFNNRQFLQKYLTELPLITFSSTTH